MQLLQCRGCATGSAGHHGVGGIGQGLHFAHGVHGCKWLAVDHVAQEADGGGAAHTGHANGGILRLRGVGGVVVGCAVCVVLDGFVGVHDGLQLRTVTRLRAGDGGTVECAVDGRDVGFCDARHASCSVGLCGDRWGLRAVVLGCVTQDGQLDGVFVFFGDLSHRNGTDRARTQCTRKNRGDHANGGRAGDDSTVQSQGADDLLYKGCAVCQFGNGEILASTACDVFVDGTVLQLGVDRA